MTVREYARLTTAKVPETLDQRTVSESAFKYLCELSAGFRKGGAQLIQLEDRFSLRLDNYVGVIQTPCGTLLEILPKYVDEVEGAESSRSVLRKMLQSNFDLSVRHAKVASIELFKSPLTEWVMHQFLLALEKLIKSGLRSEYLRVEDEQKYLRGQLNFPRQVRQPPASQHFFHIRHDVFTHDRPENRLIKAAVLKIVTSTAQQISWRLATEFGALLKDIPVSVDFERDFDRWGEGRLMARYTAIRPWCELVLGDTVPMSLKGASTGLSLLFPMEKLFERHVAVCLRRALTFPAVMEKRATALHLCKHLPRDSTSAVSFFKLLPDLLVYEGGKLSLILDTKWKRIHNGDQTWKYSDERASKYGLSQSDFYQLFAYGHKYLHGEGDVVLIYPKTRQFNASLPAFELSPTLRLWVIPFDLDNDELESAALYMPFKKR